VGPVGHARVAAVAEGHGAQVERERVGALAALGLVEVLARRAQVLQAHGLGGPRPEQLEAAVGLGDGVRVVRRQRLTGVDLCAHSREKVTLNKSANH